MLKDYKIFSNTVSCWDCVLTPGGIPQWTCLISLAVWLFKLTRSLTSVPYMLFNLYIIGSLTVSYLSWGILSYSSQVVVVNRMETCGIIFPSHKWSNLRGGQYLSCSKFLKQVLLLQNPPCHFLYSVSCALSNMTGRHACCNFLNMWKKSKISTMYYLNQDAKLSNLFLQASSPTTGTAPRSQSRLSVCPSTQDICR